MIESRAMDARRTLAVMGGKLAGALSRMLARGGGTSLPGLVATAIDPRLVPVLASQLAGTAVVSGTNGKTTTSRMLATILDQADYTLLRNHSGSNLIRGVATSLVDGSGTFGNIPTSDRLFGVFEVDEAALPEVLRAVCPRVLLLLNLFRDQLDRYGEVATVARLWSQAIACLPIDSRLVINADDPLLANLAASDHGTPLFFGIESAGMQRLDHASDVKACPHCGGEIEYTATFLGHLGHYSCQTCGFARPGPEIAGRDIQLHGVDGSRLTLVTPAGNASINLPLPGLYNVYNALGGAATAWALGIGLLDIVTGLEAATPAFGRMERLEIEGRDVILALAKNPAGLNEVLRTALESVDCLDLMLMLNDNIADGRDVSWIWDADVEMLADHVRSVAFSGTRAADMALRF
ncbi:MAG: MurT ligase domain-containing protein, partial [Chloroflexota bacterium]|nr:MurT ligase domain-containing protein [Chloroflexota bacterium]